MRFESAPKRDVWRGRGRPRREVPPQVKDMADSTYRTGNVYVVTITADEEDDLRDLVSYLNSYAGSLGRRMRVQREDDTVRFEMVDIKPRKKANA